MSNVELNPQNQAKAPGAGNNKSGQDLVGQKPLAKGLHQILNADANYLEQHVQFLVSTRKPRNYLNPSALNEVAEYICKQWDSLGLEVRLQPLQANGRTYHNVIASLQAEGLPERHRAKARKIIVGAHYDVAGNGPGADDNASGVAGLLELGRLLHAQKSELKFQVDLVAFSLEEPPFFGSNEMGSAVHAAELKKQGSRIALMMSLEMIGYFSDQDGSQEFPIPSLKKIYPSRGNFIAVAGDTRSEELVRKVHSLMSRGSQIDVQSISAPRDLPGIGLSDHRSYWDHGYPAVMITDTAFFRNPNYHRSTDRPETLDYKRMSEVVNAVRSVVLNFD